MSTQSLLELQNDSRNFHIRVDLLKDAEVGLKSRLAALWVFRVNTNSQFIIHGHLIEEGRSSILIVSGGPMTDLAAVIAV